MLRRKGFELEVFEGRMFNWDLDLVWSKKDGFLCVAKNSIGLHKQKDKLNEHHSKSIAIIK